MKLSSSLAVAVLAAAVAAAPAPAKVSLKGRRGGYTLVVPGNDVLSGIVSLTLPAKAARHAKLVPYTVTCKPGRTEPQQLVTLAAMKNGQRTLRGPAQSVGLSRGDVCTIRRRGKAVQRLAVR